MNDLPPLPPLATTTNDTSPPHLLRWRMCIGDYLRLTKPRVVVLLLLTTLVAIYLASETTSGHLPS
jgi:heme O synthase-like polyprenyltransferase